MMREEATVVIPASPEVISAILLDASSMAEWNPALLSVQGPPGPAEIGRRYPVVLRGRLHGAMVYRAVEQRRIEIDYRFPVLGTEHGLWELIEDPAVDGRSTLVVHSFTHPGLAGRLTAGIFRGVAALRVARLADRARASSSGAA